MNGFVLLNIITMARCNPREIWTNWWFSRHLFYIQLNSNKFYLNKRWLFEIRGLLPILAQSEGKYGFPTGVKTFVDINGDGKFGYLYKVSQEKSVTRIKKKKWIIYLIKVNNSEGNKPVLRKCKRIWARPAPFFRLKHLFLIYEQRMEILGYVS